MSPADPPPLGEKTGTVLLTLFQDFYRQEIGAEEDVHRTLPFFATALGLIIAAINYAAAQLPSWDALKKACPKGHGAFLNHHMLACDWPALLATILLGLAAFLGIGVLGFLARATKERVYERVGSEGVNLARAEDLDAFYRSAGLKAEDLDKAVFLDLRRQILADFARVIPINRTATLQRYRLRAKAVSLLLWSLLWALVATILALVRAKTGL